MFFCYAISAQYISSVSYPDSNLVLKQDSSLLSVQYANSITASELLTHLQILASDEFEGREAGSEGNDMAAEYIAMQFKTMGLKPHSDDNSYFQDVSFNKSYWKENSLTVNGNSYRHLWDYMAFATMNDGLNNLQASEVVFMGYGIDDPKYSDYGDTDVSGKIIMINKGEPLDKDSTSYITGSEKLSEWSESIWKKLEVAQSKNVRLVIVIEDKLQDFLGQNRRFLVNPSLRLGDGQIEERTYANHMYVSTNIAKDIIGDKDKKIKKWRRKNRKKGKTGAIELNTQFGVNMDKQIDLITGYNVLGYVEGTDKKDELIVVSAHFDHLGKRGEDIYNGADDNGSGTSAVLEIAEALALASSEGNAPKRSVLCLLVTGEEKGLLGSKYYSEDPVFPLEATMANVNIDMIGRTDKKYTDNTNYIYVIGSDRLSMDLHEINEDVNADYSGLILDYTYNDEKDRNRYYYRSDHYNFAKKGIPAIFFFSGVHEDYHRTTDTVDKIMFPKMEKVARHIFQLVWELANREESIRLNENPKGE